MSLVYIVPTTSYSIVLTIFSNIVLIVAAWIGLIEIISGMSRIIAFHVLWNIQGIER